MFEESFLSDFEFNALSAIKMNLEKYKYGNGFTILKELIQNANDAEASEIDIRFFSGVPMATHPLLKRNGVIVYNSGKFDANDARNIRTFGGDNKKSDSATIGKYGFGLKSIFHLCDAFFYYGHKEKVLQCLKPSKPQKGDADYEAWANISEEDKDSLVKQLKTAENGLSLFIPIDGKNRIGNDEIDPEHPFNKGDKTNFKLKEETLLALAILSRSSRKKTLKEFNYEAKDCSFKISVEENRCKLISEGTELEVPFATIESCVGENNIVSAEQKECISAVVEKLGKFEGEKKSDKLQENVILQLIRLPVSPYQYSELHFSFASFLPLPKQDGFNECKRFNENPDNNNYAIVVHAPFAIDSGRKDILDFDKLTESPVKLDKIDQFVDERPLQRYWNRLLFQAILAPNVPQLLCNAVKNNVLLKKDVDRVTSALKKLIDESIHKEKKYYLSKYIFLPVINQDGIKEWKLLDSRTVQKYVLVPEINAPKMTALLSKGVQNTESYFIVENEPNWLPNGEEVFDCDTFRELVDSIQEPDFESDEMIDFVKDLIIKNKIKSKFSDATTKECVKNVIIKILRRQGFSSSIEQKIKELLSYVKSFKIENKDITEDEWRNLWSIDNPFVLIPQSAQELFSNNWMRESEFKELLEFLKTCKISGKAKLRIIESVSGNSIKENILIVKLDYPSGLDIFRVKNIRENKEEYVDYITLQYQDLFNEFDINDPSGIVSKLIKLIENHEFYMMEKNDVEKYSVNNIYDANKSGVLYFLLQHYKTQLTVSKDEEIRKSFLESVFDRSILSQIIPQNHSDLYTYLLMGFKEKKSNSQICILKSDCYEVWKRVYEDCLAATNEHIEILELNENQKLFVERNDSLLSNIIWLDNAKCLEKLKQFAQKNSLDFMRTDYYQNEHHRKQVLETIPISERSLYYKLPLHKNESDEFISFVLGNTWYNKLDIKFEIEIPLLKGKIIPCERDESLKSKQDSFFITDSDKKRYETLTQGLALKAFLNAYSSEPEIIRNCCNWILERLQSYNTFSKEEAKEIESFKWIPLNGSNELYSFKDVLTTDRCSQKSFATLKESLNFVLLDDIAINEDRKKLITGFLKKQDIDLVEEISARIRQKYSNLYISLKDVENSKDIWDLAIKTFSSKNRIIKIFDTLSKDTKIHLSSDELFDCYNKLNITENLDYKNGFELLNALTGTPYCNDVSVNLFNHILDKIKDSADFKLTDIQKLPNAKKFETEWKPLKELVAIAPSTSSHDVNQNLYLKNNLCCIKTYELIGKYVPKCDTCNLFDEASDDEIKSTVDFWRQNCKQPKLVSLALYLMQGKFRKMTGALEDAILCELDKFCNEGYSINSNHLNKLFPTDQDKKNRFRLFDSINVIAEMIPESRKRALSLAGTDEEFSINPDVIFDPSVNLDLEKRTFKIKLLKSSGEFVDESIKKLIKILLWNIYKIDTGHARNLLQELFNLLDNIGQYTIKAAQKHISREIFATLKFLNVKHPKYKRLSNEMNCLDNEDDESETYSRREWDLRKEMMKTIEEDTDLQRYIFERVQYKIEQHQYFRSSILFELFQNADDCVNDYQIASDEDKQKIAEKRKFEVRYDSAQRTLKITHYGRKINRPFPGLDENTANAFKRDLQNMLSISSSEKSKENGQTGKFGLGFKSVYTICDEPIIRSGDLQFKIIAGIFPDERVDYDKTCSDCTRIELKCRDGVDVQNDCFVEFERCAEFLTVFSKQINEIRLLDKTIKPHYDDICELAQGNVSVKKVHFNDENFVMIDCKSTNNPFKMLFMEINNRLVSLTDFDSDYPRVWHLTPLEASETLPFMIHADFEIDTGRKNLAAGNKKNDKIIEGIAKNLLEILLEMLSKEGFCPQYARDIASLLLKTRNATDKYFASFAERILRGLYKREKLLVSGFGPVVTYNNNMKLYSVAASNYTDGDDSKLLTSFQDVLKICDSNAFVLTRLAEDLYTSDGGVQLEISKLSGFEFFNGIENKLLSSDILAPIIKIELSLKPTVKSSFWNSFNRARFKVKSNNEEEIEVRELYSGYGNFARFAKEKLHSSYFVDAIDFFERNELLDNFRIYRSMFDFPPQPEPTPESPSSDEYYEAEDDLKNCRELTKDDLQQLLEEKDELLSRYYKKLYSSDFYDHENMRYRNTFILDEENGDCKMTKEWCILLLYGVCQSLPYYNHQEVSLQNAIRFLNENNFIDDFCNMKNLQDIRDRFNAETHLEECYLRPFEMMLRLRRFQKSFYDFYTVVRQLPSRDNFDNIAVLLNPSMDPELSGTDIDYASINRSFKLGAHFMLRELLRNGFWLEGEDGCDPSYIEKIKPQAFMPRQKICKMLGLDNRTASSVRIYEKIGEMLPDYNTMSDTFDILFIEKEF